MMKFESKTVNIKPIAALGAIRFKSGMVTKLPHIEYENTHDYPILIYAELDNDSQKYLTNDIYLLSKQFFFKPKEKRIIQFEAFRRYDDINPIFGRGAFNVTVYEIPVFDPECVKKMVNKILDDRSSDCKCENKVEEEKEVKETPVITTVNASDLSEEELDRSFLDKFCKGIKNSVYEKWVDAGRPKEVFKYERPLNVSIYLNKILSSSPDEK